MLTKQQREAIVNKTLHYFNEDGWNCAESVYLAIFRDYYGIGVTPRTVSGYGGGIARTGNICGAVNVGVMGVSQKFGRDEPRQHYAYTQRPVYEFLKRIIDEVGSLQCSEISNCKLVEIDGIRKFRNENVKKNKCTPVVKKVVETVLFIVEDWEPV